MTEAPPGWHPDPWQPGQSRWWDGVRWTEHTSGATQPAPGWAIPGAPSTVTTGAVGPPAYLALGGAGLVALGSLLPWASVTAPLVGTITKNGIDGDGVITLVAAIVLAILAFPLARGRIDRRRVVATLVVAVLALGLCVFELIDVERIAGDLRDEDASVDISAEFGLWLTLAGAVAVCVGAALALRRPAPQR